MDVSTREIRLRTKAGKEVTARMSWELIAPGGFFRGKVRLCCDYTGGDATLVGSRVADELTYNDIMQLICNLDLRGYVRTATNPLLDGEVKYIGSIKGFMIGSVDSQGFDGLLHEDDLETALRMMQEPVMKYRRNRRYVRSIDKTRALNAIKREFGQVCTEYKELLNIISELRDIHLTWSYPRPLYCVTSLWYADIISNTINSGRKRCIGNPTIPERHSCTCPHFYCDYKALLTFLYDVVGTRNARPSISFKLVPDEKDKDLFDKSAEYKGPIVLDLHKVKSRDFITSDYVMDDDIDLEDKLEAVIYFDELRTEWIKRIQKVRTAFECIACGAILQGEVLVLIWPQNNHARCPFCNSPNRLEAIGFETWEAIWCHHCYSLFRVK